tara:strand:- start:679 stop:918 length:240 start_codon:yes stop_codon:yes gene_type:complete
MRFKRRYKKLPENATFAQIMNNSLARRYSNKRYYDEVDGEKFLVVERTDHKTDKTVIKRYSCSELKSKTKKKKGYISLF